MKRRVIVAGMLLVLASVEVQPQAPATPGRDPVMGSWNLNLQKSRFSPGPAPRMGARRYEVSEEGFINYIGVGVDSHGSPTFSQAAYKYDGKDYPVYTQSNLPLFSATGVKPGTQAYRVVDAYTVDLTPKDNRGRITFSGQRSRSVSRDGKTLTDIQKGTNAQGEVVDIVQVFDRLEIESIRAR